MRFKNVVLCDSTSCGAILRIGGPEPALCVQVEEDRAGEYFICPRCGSRTNLGTGEGDASRARQERAQRPMRS
jgi:hypothetical protein